MLTPNFENNERALQTYAVGLLVVDQYMSGMITTYY